MFMLNNIGFYMEVMCLIFALLVFVLGVNELSYIEAFLTRSKRHNYLVCCSCTCIALLQLNIPVYSSSFFLVKGFSAGLVSMIILVLSVICYSYLSEYNNKYSLSMFEFSVLFLFIVFTSILMIHSYFLLLFFLFFEVHNMCLYILISFSRNNGNHVESGLKYFILSSFSSIIMLFGIALLYCSFGSLHLLEIESLVFSSDAENVLFYKDFGFVFLLFGFSFKLYCVPFHFWVPDIYQGSPTSTTLIIACISYLSVFFVLFLFFINIRLVWILNVQNILSFFTILCLLVGGLGGIFQTQLKRLIAYSSIPGLGYVLYGFSDNNEIVFADALYFLVIHCVSLVAIFLLLLFIDVNLDIFSREYIDISNVDKLSGFFFINKYYCLLLSLLFFSISGIPPFTGFYTKFFIFEESMLHGDFIIYIVMIINSLCSCYFYFYSIKVMYYDRPFNEEVRLSISLSLDVFFVCYSIVLLLLFGISHLVVFADEITVGIGTTTINYNKFFFIT